MTLAGFREAMTGVSMEVGTAYVVDHNDQTVYEVVTWAHGERWFDRCHAPGEEEWAAVYQDACAPARASSTRHLPRV